MWLRLSHSQTDFAGSGIGSVLNSRALDWLPSNKFLVSYKLRVERRGVVMFRIQARPSSGDSEPDLDNAGTYVSSFPALHPGLCAASMSQQKLGCT